MTISTPQNNLTDDEIKAKKKRKAIIAIATQVPFAIFAFVCMFFLLNRHKSPAPTGITRGTITCNKQGQNSADNLFQYSYIIKGISYTGTLNVPAGVIKDSLVGKSFPVIYDTAIKQGIGTPVTANILITQADFKKYDMPFPDSLKWVLKYIK